MTRLQEFSERVIKSLEQTYNDTVMGNPTNAARAVLEREVRAFVKLFVDPVNTGVVDAFLDASPPPPQSEPTGRFLCVNQFGCQQETVCKHVCALYRPTPVTTDE